VFLGSGLLKENRRDALLAAKNAAPSVKGPSF